MKKKIIYILLLIESLFIVLFFLYFCVVLKNSEKKELFCESSPNGEYVLGIYEVGTPVWLFGPDHVLIKMVQKDFSYAVSFRTDVFNDGATAGYQVEWQDDAVLIILKGSEQPDAYYILPFNTNSYVTEPDS